MSCAYFTEFASFANFLATARGFINTLAYFGLGGLVAALFGRDFRGHAPVRPMIAKVRR